MSNTPIPEIRKKITAMWLGKAVGGTLGMPYEGTAERLALSYYDPIPDTMLPNDDLDLQVIYAWLMDQMPTVRVDRHALVAAWDHIGMSPDEYGICKRNRQLGLTPPWTGRYDNPFTDGMGAAIRTELWACLAAGDPELAARYAYEDACMDHDGEGVYAAQFLAALQAAAFVESDTDHLLDTALPLIPEDSRIGRAIRDTRRWHGEGCRWQTIRERVTERYAKDNFTDVAPNLAFIVLGWLEGDGDFSRSISTAVNCGLDTDCTGATLGALLGLIDPDGIEQRWLDPIGNNLVLSPCIHGVSHPDTLEGFTDLVLSLRGRLNQHPPEPTDEQPPDLAALAIPAQAGFLAALPASDSCPEPPKDIRDISLPGNWGHWPADQWDGPVLWLRYHVRLQTAVAVHLLFNTLEPCRVWFDDQMVICSDSGAPFVPALHRAAADQITRLNPSAGTHTVTAIIPRPDNKESLQWVIALCDDPPDPVERNWLTGVFRFSR
jgi:ADP-ribosylglycohydrolase